MAVRIARLVAAPSDSALARKQVVDSLVSVAGLIGRPVRDEAGHDIGKLIDIVARHGTATYPPVTGLIVKVGPRRSFIEASQIASMSNDEVRLSSTRVHLSDFVRREGESLLDADVLDHQILDVDGMRVVRSSDAYLARVDREFVIVGVDVSFRSFVRRIIPGAYRRRPTPNHVLDWAAVESLAGGVGPVRTSSSRSKLSQMRPADLADLIEDLSGREQEVLLDLLEPEVAADVLEEMESTELVALFRGLDDEKAADLLELMEPDEGAELLRELSDKHRESVLSEMSVEASDNLRLIASFDDESAGGIMNTDMLVVPESQSARDALRLLLAHEDRRSLDGVIVVDANGSLIDHVPVIELVEAGDRPLAEIVGAPFPTAVLAKTSIEDVLEEFTNNRGSSIVVVDDAQRPVGQIHADDLIDALIGGDERRWPWQSPGGIA
jgi:hypothetical protein